eukprot:s27_g19.t1
MADFLRPKRGVALPLLIAALFSWDLLFSLPKKAEPRSPIKPRNAMTSVHREVPAPMDEMPQTDQPNVISLRNEADLKEVLERVTKTGQILVVDYYAPWCRACQKLLRYMHKIAPEPKLRNVEFATVDFDRSEELVKSKHVDRLPTMEIYCGQNLKQRWSGANTRRFSERLESAIDEFGPGVVSG